MPPRPWPLVANLQFHDVHLLISLQQGTVAHLLGGVPVLFCSICDAATSAADAPLESGSKVDAKQSATQS